MLEYLQDAGATVTQYPEDVLRLYKTLLLISLESETSKKIVVSQNVGCM